MSLAEADALSPQLNLSKVLSGLVPQDYKLERLIVMAPKYVKELGNLLSDTSKETLHTYFLWKAIQGFSSYIEADALTPYKRFSNELQGKVNYLILMPRWENLHIIGP